MIVLAAMLIVAGVWATLRAYEKPLWHDELYTVYLGQLSTMSDIWRALTDAADTNPPLLIFLVRFVCAFIADPHLAYRLPSILAFLCTILCVFLVISKRTDPLSALAGAAFLLCTPLAMWSFEARPYAPMVACIAFAILAWQRLDESRFYALALSVALAASLSLHYYAVLAWPAFALGEAAVLFVRRRFRIGAWTALALGAAPLLVFAPHLSSLHQYYGPTYWASRGFDTFLLAPSWLYFGGGQDDGSATLGYWGLFFTIGVVVFLATWSLRTLAAASLSTRKDHQEAVLPVEDCALAIGLLSLPMTAFVVSAVSGVGMTGRYMLPAVLGGAMAVGYLTSRTPYRARMLVVALMLLGFGLSASPIVETAAKGALLDRRDMDARLLREALASVPETDLPVVVPSILLYLPAVYYSRPEQRARLHTFAEPAGVIVRNVRNASLDLGVLVLKRYAPLKVEDYRDFAAKHREFLLVQTDIEGWWLTKLLKDGHTLTLVAATDNALVYKVTSGATAPAQRQLRGK